MPRKNPYAVALGRRGGQVTSDRKTAAVRENAKRGGRKPKFNVGDRVIGRESAIGSMRGRTGTIVRPTHNRAEYFVRFDDARDVEEAAYSWWLEKE